MRGKHTGSPEFVPLFKEICALVSRKLDVWSSTTGSREHLFSFSVKIQLKPWNEPTTDTVTFDPLHLQLSLFKFLWYVYFIIYSSEYFHWTLLSISNTLMKNLVFWVMTSYLILLVTFNQQILKMYHFV